MAAVLACGEDAVLSHRSAAALWGIRRSRASPRSSAPPSLPVVEVTVPGVGGKRQRAGIRLHRSTTLNPADCTRRDGIPVTTASRTLDDLHRVVSPKEFAAALREAEYLKLPIGDRFTPDRTRSELEARLLSLCRRHRLPKPEVNVRVDRFVVDALWREQRLIVEVDGWQSHGTRSAFEEDRARDARLKLRGYEVVRFTWRQIESDPRGAAAAIRALIRSRSA
jgi:very-short-patch-repair endonuclease